MQPNPFLGVLLHALGGLAAGSFYIPYKKVRQWAWESYWLVGGAFSWVVAPWVVGILLCPKLVATLTSAPPKAVLWCYLFGVLWGVGGLTFGLSMRYLGMSLGYALSLGFCATFGTLIPPLFQGGFVDLLAKLSGQVTLLGVFVCLAGIIVCGLAGVQKEREVSTEEKRATIQEFDFLKGVWVAVFAGVMSACMAFAFAAGKPLAEAALQNGTLDLFKNFPVLIVALAGGFTTNCLWCLLLNVRNGTLRDYTSAPDASLLVNYVFSALAGVTWYLQFFFYSMGTTKMGRYDFSSWTIHMAFIIVFSNLWGLAFREWKGSSRKTHTLIVAGILVLVASTIVVGIGNWIAAQG
ncbi:MAG: L-rhamnose/proton symporter RhaT [Armatimonadetes bacterium CG_4_10_14_3_um_filter_66_18]|nr:L-rhamnose/proton symporter RhaT [Armatimonadota bacterium]PIU95062.1 MAG: L-rhamnose/proton symporter RhaT [Armatimonadetes bacterium CG06_land_8_20_14_3_00_66_21]PIX37428.1 MAG: L-rhamnose/proton symporter RhaT [Armatimonadetes bacterium CG_4_8_14_3_um_filter_66_20]PIY43082.1 MAG: L-rhamnose/proton symporter RhaT [Armatimonadetes bacterium CG_4_10_14_3_um_filter_66_18]PIZ49888.1 MAG: L-rhamnose/proton symporter RhaT [Armatimonadetes bacterium CG_4_10_14_0_8_um_filter_66_14]PJB62670.1 MAG: